MTIAAPPMTGSSAIPEVAEDRRGTGVPVMEMQDVERAAVGAQRLQRGPAEQPEAPRVVGVVAGVVAVEALAIECRRVVDQPQPVAVGRDVEDGHGRSSRRGPRVRHGQRRSRSDRRGSGPARPDSAAGTRRPGRRRRRVRHGPSARASASTTSARPPVLAHGSHSAARNATRSPIGSHGSRGAATCRRPARGRSTKPVHMAAATRLSCARMDPVSIPSIPAAAFPLPPRLEGLRRLAYNLHWAWDPRDAEPVEPGRPDGLDRYRNPIPVISGPTEWSRLLDDEKFLAEYQDVLADFDRYMANGTGHWFQRATATSSRGPIAYFCAEYGIHESLGIYSGGLGVLAGDHMKSASDMALPFVGVGLLYRKGYFRQSIDADGHQEHDYPDYDLTRLPLARVQDANGLPLTVNVELPGRDLSVAVWLAQVGRVPVLLLDTDVAENAVEDRPITHILYVRGREMRLHQELVLGIGGVRAIRALGLAAGGVAPQRGPLGVPARRARPRVRRGRCQLEDAWARGPARQRVHDPHAGLGRQRALRRRARPPRRRPAARRGRRAGRPTSCELGLGHGRRPEPVRHDGLQPAPDERRERGQQAPRRDRQRDLEGRRRPRDPGHHQRRPRADLGRLAGRGALLAPPGRRPRRARRRAADRTGSGSASTASRRADLWEAHLRQKRELAIFVHGRLRNQFARHGEAPSVLAEVETGPRPGDPDDRLRPPVRDLQAGRRCCSATWTGSRACCGTPIGRSRSSSPARPIPPTGPGRGSSRRSSSARARRSCAAGSSSSRTTTCASARFLVQGVDALAQQPAPAARGVRDVGHEGRPERRPQHQRARRLVGRGLRGRQRLGDRRPRAVARRGRPGLGRRPGPLPAARGGARPGLLRARGGRRPDALD